MQATAAIGAPPSTTVPRGERNAAQPVEQRAAPPQGADTLTAAVEEPPHSPSGCAEMDAIDRHITALMGASSSPRAEQAQRTPRQPSPPIGESLPMLESRDELESSSAPPQVLAPLPLPPRQATVQASRAAAAAAKLEKDKKKRERQEAKALEAKKKAAKQKAAQDAHAAQVVCI